MTSRLPFIAKIQSALEGTPLYRPARYLYNKLALRNARCDVEVHHLRASFWTPTFKVMEDLHILAERDLLVSFLEAIHEGDTVWDIGANIGLYTLFAAKVVGSNGCVVACEPEPKTRALLQRNIELNELQNITVVDFALGKTGTTGVLYPSATPNPGSHSLVQRTDYRVRKKGISVTVSTGDTLIRERGFGTPSAVKIDVEGAEMDVLLGMGNVLQNDRLRTILVEVHPKVLPLFGASIGDVEQKLASHGFSRVSRVDRGTEYHLVCYRN